MESNPKIFRHKSIRLEGYDYTQAGAYFITICTHNRLPVLGSIHDGKVSLSAFGDQVQTKWEDIPQHFHDVLLDVFVIMPNHFHGILWLPGRKTEAKIENDATSIEFGTPKPGSLPTILGSFKSSLTRSVNLLRGKPGSPFWQRNYYEHIIRNEEDLFNIQKYIQDNPAKWELDRYFPPIPPTP